MYSLAPGLHSQLFVACSTKKRGNFVLQATKAGCGGLGMRLDVYILAHSQTIPSSHVAVNSKFTRLCLHCSVVFLYFRKMVTSLLETCSLHCTVLCELQRSVPRDKLDHWFTHNTHTHMHAHTHTHAHTCTHTHAHTHTTQHQRQ